MLSILKFKLLAFPGLRGGLFDCDCACAAPVNNQPLADASKESAQIMADLGQKQIDEARRQYDKNMAVAKPVIDTQLAIMDQTKTQGQDYYDYLKGTFRPLEQKMVAEADAAGSTQRQEEAAGRAIADTRAGSTSATNAIIRQGIRYGMAPSAIAARMGAASVDLASKEASAANNARTAEEVKGWAKKMDAAGLGRNLSGASQGAYSVATTAGNSAVGNQNSTGTSLMNGMATGASITGQGQQMQLQGLTSILNSDTAISQSNNARAASQGASGFSGMLSGLGGLGQGLGAMKVAGLFGTSSKKLKTDKSRMTPVLAGIKNLNIQDWKYKVGVADGGKHSGPYAEDVHREFGDRAAPGGKVIDIMTMQGIALKGIQELAQKVDDISAETKAERKLKRMNRTARKTLGET